MPTNAKKSEQISLVNATPVEFLLVSKPITTPCDIIIDTDSANAGTIQFEVSQTGLAAPNFTGCEAYGSSRKAFFTVENGLFNIWAKASAGTQKFTITY